LCFSATNWRTAAKNTTDAGATWNANASNSPPSANEILIRCKGTATHAISADIDSTPNIYHTEDSGANWAAAGTQPPNVTSVLCGTYTTSGLVLVAGQNSGAGGVDTNIWRSVDQGATWAPSTTGPTGASPAIVYAIDMYDANNGICITDDGSLWTTTDAGVNWTDSTKHSVLISGGQNMYALSATTYIAITGINKAATPTNFYIDLGNTAVNGVVKYRIIAELLQITNICKCTNGYFYFATISTFSSQFSNIILYRSKDSGVTWSAKVIPLPGNECEFCDYENSLAEYSANKMAILLVSGTVMTIDVSVD
jgi:hypothetical protein